MLPPCSEVLRSSTSVLPGGCVNLSGARLGKRRLVLPLGMEKKCVCGSQLGWEACGNEGKERELVFR